MKAVVIAGCVGVVSAASIPTIKLNTGAEMPMMSFGTWKYDSQTAEDSVKLAIKTGFNHIDTANDYNNQDGVGRALKGFNRSSYFLTTKVPPGSASATTKALNENMKLLDMDYVDLVLVHYPPLSAKIGLGCSSMQAQWKVMEDFYKSGKAKAIGVSNYCPSSLECIAKTATVTPAVNQVLFHVGMGIDPIGLKSYSDSKGIVTQAYSPLGDGTSELITGDLVTGIGKAHNATGSQVSLRWLIETGVPLSTKTSKQSHMQEDLEIFGDKFPMAATEKAKLDAATKPAGSPSFICTKSDTTVVV